MVATFYVQLFCLHSYFYYCQQMSHQITYRSYYREFTVAKAFPWWIFQLMWDISSWLDLFLRHRDFLIDNEMRRLRRAQRFRREGSEGFSWGLLWWLLLQPETMNEILVWMTHNVVLFVAHFFVLFHHLHKEFWISDCVVLWQSNSMKL